MSKLVNPPNKREIQISFKRKLGISCILKTGAGAKLPWKNRLCRILKISLHSKLSSFWVLFCFWKRWLVVYSFNFTIWCCRLMAVLMKERIRCNGDIQNSWNVDVHEWPTLNNWESIVVLNSLIIKGVVSIGVKMIRISNKSKLNS